MANNVPPVGSPSNKRGLSIGNEGGNSNVPRERQPKPAAVQ